MRRMEKRKKEEERKVGRIGGRREEGGKGRRGAGKKRRRKQKEKKRNEEEEGEEKMERKRWGTADLCWISSTRTERVRRAESVNGQDRRKWPHIRLSCQNWEQGVVTQACKVQYLWCRGSRPAKCSALTWVHREFGANLSHQLRC